MALPIPTESNRQGTRLLHPAIEYSWISITNSEGFDLGVLEFTLPTTGEAYFYGRLTDDTSVETI